MRKAQSVQKVQFLAPDVIPKVIPAPTDGLDAISPLAEMDPKRAPILQNWVPRPGFVELRGGYVTFSIVSTVPVDTLMTYRSPLGEKLFAGTDSRISDISTGVPVIVVTGLTNDRWQYINFTSAAGVHVLQCVNGSDALRQFDGTNWSTPTITGLPGGLTTANIINIYAQKQRLWYIFANSTVAAFMPTGAITGPIASTQDFGTLFTKGGFLVAMSDWTIDGGAGPQDYALFISSRGQVALYSGTDPTNASAWSLVGVFDVSPPIGRRCLTRVGSDVAVITQAGVIPISQSLPFDPSADRSVAITARIQNAMASAALMYGGNFGWEFVPYPEQTLSILNVPYAENNQQVQYVINTLTGAWCQFTGWNANTFAIFNDKLYWGDNLGNVNLGYASASDLYAAIVADMQCAFNWFDEPGRTKRMTMVQPLLTIGGGVTPTIAVDTDFQSSTSVAPISSIAGTVLWDQATWDVSQWPALTVNFKNWLSVNALGHTMAIRMRVSLAGANSQLASTFDTATFDNSQFDGTFNTVLPTLQVNAFNSVVEMGGAI